MGRPLTISHKASREHTVTGQDVGERAAKQTCDAFVEYPVAEAVVSLAIHSSLVRYATTHHHIEILGKQANHHCVRTSRVVGIVTVYQHISICVDKHALHHVTLTQQRHAIAPAPLATLMGAVAGIVVEHVRLSLPAVRHGNRA